MKPQWNKKYTTIALYVALVLLAGVLSVFFFLRLDEIGKLISGFIKICSPILYGISVAYILNPLLRLYEEKLLFGKKGSTLSRRAKRILSVVLTMLSFFLFLALFVWMILPQLVASVKDLGERLPDYLKSVNELAASLTEKGGAFSGIINSVLERINAFIDSSYDILNEYLPKITTALQSVAAALFDVVLGFVFAAYFLCSKERIASQFSKMMHALFSEKKNSGIRKIMTLADKTFGRYFTGAILDSFLVGVVCFIFMTILGMPYAPLISAVIGVTNIIPVFGPFIGAIPSALILFVYKPIFAIYFAAIIFLIQQIDGNFIAPKIHGASTGLAPVWVIVSITFMSGLFGIIGMFVGVPVFSVIYTLTKEKIEQKLSQKNAVTDTFAYMSEKGQALNAPKPENGSSQGEKKKGFFRSVGGCFKKAGAFFGGLFRKKK